MAGDQIQQDGFTFQSANDLKKLAPEKLIDMLVQAGRTAERRLLEEKQRSRADLERLRNTNSQHIRDLEEQNGTLLKMLTRVQGENDKLKSDVVTLQVRLEGAVAAAAAAAAAGARLEEAPPVQKIAVAEAVAPAAGPAPAPIPIATNNGPSLSGEPIPASPKPH